MALLEVSHLKKYFQVSSGILHAVDDVSFTLEQGKTLGVVGESGCGKSTLGKAIIRLTHPTAGKVVFDGTDVAAYSAKEFKKVRPNMQMIFQDPFASLDPRRTVTELIAEPMAAAIGAGLQVEEAAGCMVVDIGGGTTDIAVISLAGTVVSNSVKLAGDDFDEALVRYMRKKHNLLIGERTAEEIKINIGAAYKRPEVVTMEVRGRNLVTGLPKTIVVTSDETLEALKEPAMQIVDAVHNVLERTPPELAADIFDRGIVLTGGGSLLSGLDALIEEKTGIATMIAEDPLTAVAVGTGKFIEFEHEDDRGFFKR